MAGGQSLIALEENQELIGGWVEAVVPLTKVQVLRASSRGISVLSAQPIRKSSRDLGVPSSSRSIFGGRPSTADKTVVWVVAAGDAGTRPGLTTGERDELARLRRENRTLRERSDILKRAVGFFARATQ